MFKRNQMNHYMFNGHHIHNTFFYHIFVDISANVRYKIKKMYFIINETKYTRDQMNNYMFNEHHIYETILSYFCRY